MGPRYTLPADRLETRFGEKKPAYEPAEAKTEALRCLYCHDAPCITACPTSIDIPTFIRKIATGNVRGSARVILEANLLGASCARVCPVEVLCEGSCVYVGWGRKPIEIGRLQRFAMDGGASPDLLPREETKTGKSVGLIGAGPASLACAGTLARLGHDAVIYERGELPGGLNTTGVAPYKMFAAEALDEVAFVEALGVEIRTGVEIGKDVTLDDLIRSHDAVFVGIGLGQDSMPDVPGWDGPGVTGAVEWIRRMKNEGGASIDGVARAIVLGGGNTAIDVVRELAQLGVPSVTMAYRRGADRMSGYAHEWDQAKREGVTMIENALVSAVVREGGRVVGVELEEAVDGKPSGKSLGRHEADLVVAAIGQAKIRDLLGAANGVELDDRGRIVVDPETGATGHSAIWAGGDAVNGGKEVVNAVDEGQRAARGIDAALKAKEGGGDA